MRWEGNRESDNIEDRRNGGGRDEGGGQGGGRRLGGNRSVGLGTIVLVLIASAIFGINPLTLLNQFAGGAATVQTQPHQTPEPSQTRKQNGSHTASSRQDDTMRRFVATILADTEDVWPQLLQAEHTPYREPKLVLFRGSTPTACGRGESAMGPFYCPGDQKVYIDLAFYETLKHELGAPGDFAQAYVIAHEVGHHVQNLLGISAKVEAMQARASEAQGNALSVRLELQADCFAGVWAHHAEKARHVLEQGDIEEAMNAAARIGDDALQKAAQGHAVPETFTHGTSKQRMTWFQRGLQSGQIRQCNTFEGKV